MSFKDLGAAREARMRQSPAALPEVERLAIVSEPATRAEDESASGQDGVRVSASPLAVADGVNGHSPGSGILALSSTSQSLPEPTLAEPTTPSPDAHLYPELQETGLEIRVARSSGRGLYAMRKVSLGTTLLRLPPRTAVLSNSKLTTHCSSCFQAKKVQRCAACKAAHYCSSACQKADWPQHKPECKALIRFRGMWAAQYPDRAKDGRNMTWVLNESVRALGRVCWSRRGGGKVDANWWKQVAAMATAAAGDKSKLLPQVHHLRHYIGAAEPLKPGDDPALVHPADMEEYGFTQRELIDMCSAFMNNSFTLTTPDLTPVGVAMSPVCALFNHSCAPNAVVVFPSGPTMEVVALADIEPGQEVLTSYIDVSQPYAERQLELRERYGFTCACSLCSMPRDWVDPRWSVRHPGCAQGGCGRMADLHGGDGAVVCSACTQTFTVDVRQLRRKIEEGKRLLAVDEPDPLGHSEGLGPEDLPVLISAIDALAPLVPHSAHPQLQLIHLAASLLLPSVKEPSARARALALLDRSLAGGAHSFPAHHPTLALWAAERARVLMLPISPATSFLKDVVEAVDALRTAIKQCDSAFGKGGTVARGLRTELEHAEQIAAMVAARS